MSLKKIFLLLVCLPLFTLQAQNSLDSKISRKSYQAQRIANAPIIDGLLDDTIWKEVPSATDFVMSEPGNGTPSRTTHPTIVKLAYDDEAIYIAAYMKDYEPERILRQFTQRDNIEQSDFFLIDINTYNDAPVEAPFGGTKLSGIGRENSKAAINHYSQLKSVYVRMSKLEAPY